VPNARPLEAITAIDGLIVARQERHLILFAALGADDGMHFARPTVPAGGHCLLAALSAIWAAAWLVEQSFLLIELLLACREDEILSALPTL
jgi:hypothetical protein